MRLKINYRNIPVLAIAFTRSTSLIGTAIRFFRGNIRDKAFPNHAFLVTEDHGQLFATEETFSGLVENSLEEYSTSSNQIVSMYSWIGFNDIGVRESALQYLAEIRRRRAEDSKYDFKGILSFVPGLKVFFKPDTKKQWCSENVSSILKQYGGAFIKDVHVAPDQLEMIIRERSDQFSRVDHFYTC